MLVHGGAGDVPAERVARHVDGCRAAAQAAADVLAKRRHRARRRRTCCRRHGGRSVVQRGDGRLPERGRAHRARRVAHGGHASARRAACARCRRSCIPSRSRAPSSRTGSTCSTRGRGLRASRSPSGFTPSTTQAMTTESRGRAGRRRARSRGHDGWAGGTVGAVARDARGVVAAATSTGGRDRTSASGGWGTRPSSAQATTRTTTAGPARPRATARRSSASASAKSAADLMRDARASRGGRACGHPSAGRRGSPATGGVILVDRTGRLGFARNTRTMTWAAAGERLRSARGGRLSQDSLVAVVRTGLAVDRVLHAVAQTLRALDALGLERRGQPLVTLPHVPDCAVRHVEAAQFARNPAERQGIPPAGVSPGRE